MVPANASIILVSYLRVFTLATIYYRANYMKFKQLQKHNLFTGSRLARGDFSRALSAVSSGNELFNGTTTSFSALQPFNEFVHSVKSLQYHKRAKYKEVRLNAPHFVAPKVAFPHRNIGYLVNYIRNVEINTISARMISICTKLDLPKQWLLLIVLRMLRTNDLWKSLGEGKKESR